MAAKNSTLVVSGTHMKMGVKFPVHGVNGSGKGNDFEITLKLIRVIFLFGGIKNANSKVVSGTKGGDTGKFDVFGKCNGFDLFKNFFAFIDASDDSVIKFLIFHIFSFSLVNYSSQMELMEHLVKASF